MSEQEAKTCVFCLRSDDLVPLLAVSYRQTSYWICSEHLPVLIHDPAQLIGRLPGAESLRPADHED